MTESTKVLYDVSQAVKELEKLNRKVDEAGGKSSKAFKEGSRSAKLFDRALTKLPRSTRDVATGVRGITTSFGGMAAVSSVAVGAIGALVAQFIDLEGIMRNTLKSLEAFSDATGEIQKSREAISNLGDQSINRDNRLAQRSLQLARAENARQQNTVEIAKGVAQNRLEVLRAELTDREDLLADSINREQDIRSRLADRNQTDAGSQFAGFDDATQAARLGQAARDAALEGNIDLAEELERAAAGAAENVENQAFFLRDQQKTRDAINQKLQEQLASEEDGAKASQAAVSDSQSRVDELQKEVDLLEKRAVLLTQETRELGAQRQQLRVKTQEDTDSQKADTAARSLEKNSRDFGNNIRRGGSTFRETVIQAGSEFAKLATNEAQRQNILDKFRAAGGAAGRAEETIGRVQRGEAVTSVDIEALNTELATLTDAVAQLKVFQGEDRLSGNSAQQLSRLEGLLSSFREITNAAASFRSAGRLDSEAIREGSVGATGEQIDALRNSIIEQTRVISQIPASVAPTASVPSAQSQGAAAPLNHTSTINVNANVKGGIIDAEVTREITRIIREELRKGTSQGTTK